MNPHSLLYVPIDLLTVSSNGHAPPTQAERHERHWAKGITFIMLAMGLAVVWRFAHL